jgi:PAS domain S-box-containing protein
MRKMFGYPLKEIRNKPVRMFFPDDHAFEALERKSRPVLLLGKIHEQEIQLRCKNGGTMWCHIRGAAIDPEKPDGDSIWVILDIEHIKQTEQQLELLNRELGERVIEETRKNIEQERILTHQARLAAMGEMIGNIAHQWRQPLNTLGLVVQNIAEDYRDGLLEQTMLDEYRDTAINTVHKMSCTIDDFRNFFQPNRKKERFDLQKPIREAYNLIEASMKNNSIAVTIDCPDDLTAFFPTTCPVHANPCGGKQYDGYAKIDSLACATTAAHRCASSTLHLQEETCTAIFCRNTGQATPNRGRYE